MEVVHRIDDVRSSLVRVIVAIIRFVILKPLESFLGHALIYISVRESSGRNILGPEVTAAVETKPEVRVDKNQIVRETAPLHSC